MNSRRDRLARAAHQAEAAEQQAQAKLARARLRLRATDDEREAMLDRAGLLAEQDLPSGLRGHLASVGANHLVALTNEKARLALEAGALQADVDEARVRVRSLERVVSRLDEAEAQQRRRLDQANLQDLVAARTNRRTS